MIKQKITKSESTNKEKDAAVAHAAMAHAAMAQEASINRERELHDKIVLQQEAFSNTMIRAAAAVTESRTKLKLMSSFQKKTASYADNLARYNIEILNLESKINHLKTKIEPAVKIINSLKEGIDRHIFLYQDNNSHINNIFTEIENILFEYSRKINSNEFENIIVEKKYLLERKCQDIENLEIRILSMELKRLNRKNEIQTNIDELKDLDLQLKYLKNKKTQKEFSDLFKITTQPMKDFERDSQEELVLKDEKILDLNPHQTQNQSDFNK